MMMKSRKLGFGWIFGTSSQTRGSIDSLLRIRNELLSFRQWRSPRWRGEGPIEVSSTRLLTKFWTFPFSLGTLSWKFLQRNTFLSEKYESWQIVNVICESTIRWNFSPSTRRIINLNQVFTRWKVSRNFRIFGRVFFESLSFERTRSNARVLALLTGVLLLVLAQGRGRQLKRSIFLTGPYRRFSFIEIPSNDFRLSIIISPSPLIPFFILF